MAPAKSIKVAAAQLPGLPLDQAARSLELIDEAIASAAAARVDLLVLPECAYPAYYLGSIAAYRAADLLSGDAFVSRLADAARKHKISLVCGFIDDAGENLRNAAVIIDAKGNECGRTCKNFLWGEDNDWVAPGERIAPIDTPVGRIGVVICADGRAPEIAMGLVAQGARLLVIPTCWVNVATEPGGFVNAQAEFMVCGRAIEAGVPIVAANKFGMETETLGYCGWSVIYDAKAKMLAQAPPDKSALICAELKLAEPPKVEVPDWAVRRIFSNDPPVPPDAFDIETVKVAAIPACLLTDAGKSPAAHPLEALAADGVQVICTWLADVDRAERFDIYGRALGMVVIDYAYVERLMIERFGAFGCVESRHLHSFVPSRVMALDGAAIVFVIGPEAPFALLRTRAVENRVFIASASKKSAVLIDPAGKLVDVCDESDPRPVVAEIDLAQSALKEVFPGTDIWQQRRPDVYAEAFGIKAIHAEV